MSRNLRSKVKVVSQDRLRKMEAVARVATGVIVSARRSALVREPASLASAAAPRRMCNGADSCRVT